MLTYVNVEQSFLPIAFNMKSPDTMIATFETVTALLGPVSVLVNVACIEHPTSLVGEYVYIHIYMCVCMCWLYFCLSSSSFDYSRFVLFYLSLGSSKECYDTWKEIYEVNVLGIAVCMQEAVNHMVNNGLAGHIINVFSSDEGTPIIVTLLPQQ